MLMMMEKLRLKSYRLFFMFKKIKSIKSIKILFKNNTIFRHIKRKSHE